MLELYGKDWHTQVLAKVSPLQVIFGALLLAFLVFILLQMFEIFILKEELTSLHLLHFARGFLATSGGMFLVWKVMQNKEEELLRLRDRFADQLAERTEELKQQRDDACRFQNALLNEREDFLAVICHRLRTPVIANRRTIELLLEDSFGTLNEQQTEILNLLSRNNDDIERLLSKLIDVYKYKNSRHDLQKQDHSLSRILSDLSAGLQELAARKRKRLTVNLGSGDQTSNCDRAQVTKLIMHLAENAVAFANSEIVISCTTESHSAVLCVEDDGRGIAPEDAKTIFDRFFLISAQGAYSPITGIGLSLCKEIVSAHQGQISCERSSLGGAKFLVRLPLSDAGGMTQA